MFGRFFAFEMGCPEEDTYLNEGEANQGYMEAPDGTTLICECRGLGCNKCKRKKAKIITLTGRAAPMPVMNMMGPVRMPLAPWSMDMIMLNKQTF